MQGLRQMLPQAAALLSNLRFTGRTWSKCQAMPSPASVSLCAAIRCWPGEQACKREALLTAPEAVLEPIAAANRRAKRRLKGADKIGERAGEVTGTYKMAKHFAWPIDADGALVHRRRSAAIAAEAAPDGLCVIHTSLPEAELDGPQTLRAYKRLTTDERAFRSLKTVDLLVRPVFHRTAGRVRAHVLVCMPAYYVEWHMRRKLRAMLFDDEEPEAAGGEPVHSFRTLLQDLATVCRNTVAPRLPGAEPFKIVTRPTPLQQQAFKLLGVRSTRSQ